MADCGAMNITLCLTDTKPEPWKAGLQAAFPDAHISSWQPGDPQADYAVVWAPPQAFLDQQPGLRALFNIGAGVDALMKSRLPAGVPVVRLDDAGMSVQMAEFVAHAVIRHFRELDGYEADVAQGKWSYRKPRLRSDFTVGVMGLGVLGQRVAQALRLFEFPVRGYSRSAKQIEGIDCFSGPVGGDGFQAFLQGTRVLVCLLPLTPETENVIDHRTLAALAPGAYVINVARGAHLVEADLLAALASGQLAAATLDALTQEPLPPEHPFWADPRILITPHIATRTDPAVIARQTADNLARIDAGRAAEVAVDLQRGY